MSQSNRLDAGSLLWGIATAIVLVFAIIENGFFFLALTWSLAFTIILFLPLILGLTYLLFLWLRFRHIDARWALLGSALAAAAAPWTWFLLLAEATEFLPGPKGQEAASLFGPLIPYALIAAIGLGKRR